MANKSIHDDRYKAVIDKLITARNKAGLTQQQVADALDKQQSFVAKYENCERRLDVIELHDICSILGIEVPVA